MNQANRALASLFAAKADFREARHFYPRAAYRTRKEAKKVAARAARRLNRIACLD